MPAQPHVLNWLLSVLTNEYQDANRAYRDVADVLERYPSLLPRTDVYTFPNGSSALLLHLSGTLPVSFRGVVYRFPISLWLPHNYPHIPPLAFVTPADGMTIRPGQHVDPQGQIFHPYLDMWSSIWDKSTLKDLLGILSDVFTKEPPVVSQSQTLTASTPVDSAAALTPKHLNSLTGPSPPPLPPKVTAAGQSSPADDRENADISSSPRRKQGIHSIEYQKSSPLGMGEAMLTHSRPPRPPRPPPPPPHSHRAPVSPLLPRSSSMHVSSYEMSPSHPALRPAASPALPDQQHHRTTQPNHFKGSHGHGQMLAPREMENTAIQVTTPHVHSQHAAPATLLTGQWKSPPPVSREPPFKSSATLQSLSKPDSPPNLLDEPIPNKSSDKAEPHTAPPVPPNPQKDAMIRQLGQTLYSLRQASIRQNESTLAGLEAQRAAMRTAATKLHAELDLLNQLSSLLTSNSSILHDGLRKASLVIEQSRDHPEPDVDELLVAPTVVAGQLYTLVAEERAIGDTLFVLSRAMEKGRVSTAIFMKTTRSLAREWYLKKALIRKIALGMGLLQPMDTT